MARRDAAWWPLNFSGGEARVSVTPYATFVVRRLNSGAYSVRSFDGNYKHVILNDLLELRVHLVQFAQEDDAIADEIINPHTPEVRS